jgi:adenine phosphoribosyltransferase
LATAQVVERLGGDILGCAFIVDLPDLGGSSRLTKYDVHTLVQFAGD